MFSPSGEQIEITRGDQRAVVVEVGGGLRAYSAGGRELLDAYPADGQIASGRGQVLIPWPNRIEDGAYEFDGKQQQLALDELEARNAIHGLVRWAGWRIGEREQSRVVLEHVLHPQPGYPVPRCASRSSTRSPTRACRLRRRPRTSARTRARTAAASIRT